MIMRRLAALLLMTVLALAGCDPVTGQTPAPEPSPEPSAPADDLPTNEPAPNEPAPTADPDGQTVTGTLDGDAQLEGGCVWLEVADGNIQLLLPDGYTTSVGPVALIGPDGAVIAEQGDPVTVVGSPAPEISTICQVGSVWRVSAVKSGG